VLDMPNTKPPTVTIADLHAKIELAAGRAYTDYAMIFGTTTDNQAEIAALEPGSVVGVKFFMAGHETTPTVVTDLGALYASLREVKAKGLVALFHAEHQGLINWLDAAARAANRPDDGRTYSESRSPLTAATAIREAVALCANLNLAAYICHVSTRAELTAIAEARRSGAIVYAEAVGYHLTFTIDEYESLGTLLKVSPPVRESVEREALWDALHGGSISTLASEHTPHTRAEKNRPMRAAASGMPGIQENLPMVISQYRSRYPQLPLDDLIHHVALLGSTHVAQIFGLSTHKGSIAIGQDADIAVLDPDQTWTIAESDLFSKCGWSAYTGRTTSCRVIATYLRGTPVYRDGQIIGEPTGKLLRQASG